VRRTQYDKQESRHLEPHQREQSPRTRHYAPYSPGGGTTAHSVLTAHNNPVLTTPYSPGGGTTAQCSDPQTGAPQVLFHAVRRLCPHAGGWAAALSAGMFAFSPLVWTHATQVGCTHPPPHNHGLCSDTPPFSLCQYTTQWSGEGVVSVLCFPILIYNTRQPPRRTLTLTHMALPQLWRTPLVRDTLQASTRKPELQREAPQAEVFALNNVLAASLLLLVAAWFDTPETRGHFATRGAVAHQHRIAKVTLNYHDIKRRTTF
jgi:hypothetical protein